MFDYIQNIQNMQCLNFKKFLKILHHCAIKKSQLHIYCDNIHR